MGLGVVKASAVFALAWGALGCGPPRRSEVTEAKTLELLSPTRSEPRRLDAQTRPTLTGPAEPIDLGALPVLEALPPPPEGIVVGTEDEVDVATWTAGSVEVVRTLNVLLPSREVTTTSVRVKAAALVPGILFALRAASVDPSASQLMLVAPRSTYHVTSNAPDRYPAALPYLIALLPIARGTSSSLETILTLEDVYKGNDLAGVVPKDLGRDVEGLVYSVDLVCPAEGDAMATLFRGELRRTPPVRVLP